MTELLNFYKTEEALPNGDCVVLAKIRCSIKEDGEIKEGAFWEVVDYIGGVFGNYSQRYIKEWAKLGDANE